MLHYPCDHVAKHTAPEEKAVLALVGAWCHPTKKEGQSTQPGSQLGSFSDCQGGSVARCNHVGEAVKGAVKNTIRAKAVHTQPPSTPNTVLYSLNPHTV